jgi:DNA-binding transcriptional regulator YiaG
MVAPGKNMEANEYFHTVARQVKKITGTDIRILNQLGGPMGHFVLSSTFDTLSAWEQMRTKLQSDVPFQKLVAQAGNDGLFIPGSVTSGLWQQVQ